MHHYGIGGPQFSAIATIMSIAKCSRLIVLLIALVDGCASQSGESECNDTFQPLPNCYNGGVPMCQGCVCPEGYGGDLCISKTVDSPFSHNAKVVCYMQ